MGANPIEDLAKYREVTHFIVGNSEEAMSRTMKLMMAISYGVPVVKIQWLVDSSNAGELLPCDEYFPDDKSLQDKHNFTIKASITNALTLLKSGGLLASFSVYICPGVAGNGKGQPPVAELNLLIKANGAKILTTQTSISSHDITKVLLISSYAGQVFKSPKLVKAKEAGCKTVPLADLFLALTQQSLASLPITMNQQVEVEDTPPAIPPRTSHSKTAATQLQRNVRSSRGIKKKGTNGSSSSSSSKASKDSKVEAHPSVSSHSQTTAKEPVPAEKKKITRASRDSNRAVSDKAPSQPSKDFAAKAPEPHFKSNDSKGDASTPKTGLHLRSSRGRKKKGTKDPSPSSKASRDSKVEALPSAP